MMVPVKDPARGKGRSSPIPQRGPLGSAMFSNSVHVAYLRRYDRSHDSYSTIGRRCPAVSH
jgi:hypothetical protein